MSSETKQILTTDGIPLEVSLKKAEKKNKIKAFLLVAPLLLFIIITYVFPIGDMLMRSVDDKMVTEMLPKTFKSMEKWDGQDLPPEEVFEAFYFDFQKLIEQEREGKLSTQLNYTKNGYWNIPGPMKRPPPYFDKAKEYANPCSDEATEGNILENINFQVNPGQLLTVLGHSGAGKTTLAKALVGFIEPSKGAIRLDGVSVF